MDKRCRGEHEHVHLLQGRAKAAEVYPEKMCQAIVEAYAVEKKAREEPLMSIETELDEVTLQATQKYAGQEWWEMQNQWDENTGQQLDPKKVREGRAKELKHFKERGVYEPVLREEALRNPEAKILRTRWVQTVKDEEVRCRLVAQEFAAGDPREDLFSGTPPLFAARLLTSRAASRPRQDWCLMALDVSCAFLYADATRELYVELPKEDPKSQGGAWVGRLRRAMYGTRDAPQRWFAELGNTLKDMGFVSSQLHPGVYHHPVKDITVVAHVDDLLCGGRQVDLEWLRTEMQKKYLIKGKLIQRIGESVNFLGRELRWAASGLEWIHGHKHVERLLKDWGMEQCQPVNTPVVIEKESKEGEPDPEEMTAEDATIYRRAVARVNYLAQDRADLCFVANLMSRTMARPRIGDEVRLKRVIRYLKGHPSCVIVHVWQGYPTAVTATADSDWAGCRITRRSVSGIVVTVGGHVIATHSRLQKAVALSSGEAELNAQVSGIIEGMGVVNLLAEWGSPLRLVSRCDSSAARGILQRVGVGKMKHLEVKTLWMQELVQNGRVSVERVRREFNAADVLTHGCTWNELSQHLARVNVLVRMAPAVGRQAPSEGGC